MSFDFDAHEGDCSSMSRNNGNNGRSSSYFALESANLLLNFNLFRVGVTTLLHVLQDFQFIR
jgi:hypothetical protein